MPPCEVLQIVQELRILQWECAVVSAVALDDHGCDVVVVRKDGIDRGNVHRGDYHGVEDFLGDAAESLAGFGRNIIVPAVEVLVELDYLGLSGEGACQPESEVG